MVCKGIYPIVWLDPIHYKMKEMAAMSAWPFTLFWP